jgi:Flp pilus assembly protein TadD
MTSESETVVFYGNCQALGLSLVYQRVIAPVLGQRVVLVDVTPGMARDPSAEALAVKSAAFVVYQIFDWPKRLKQDDFNQGARFVRFPQISAGFLWPYGNQKHIQNEKLSYISHGPWPANIGDSYLNRLISKNVPFDEAVAQYLNLDIAKSANIDRLYELSMDRQRERDALSDFGVADEIVRRFRQEQLFLTPDHLALPMFKLLARHVFARLGVDEALIEESLRAVRLTPFPWTEAPLHPGIIKHFGLEWASEDKTYPFWYEGSYSFRESVLRYLDYRWNRELQIALASQDLDHQQRVAVFDRALAVSPWSLHGWLSLSDNLVALGRLEEAEGAARRGVAVDPEAPEGHATLARVLAAKNDLPGAEKAARRAIELFPREAQFHVGLAAVLNKAGRSIEAAAAVREAARLAPGDERVHSQLGHDLIREGDAVGAEAAFRRCIALNSSQEGYYGLLGEALRRQDRFDEAIAVLREVVDGGTTNPHILGFYGAALRQIGDLPGAEAAYRRAAELDPSVDGFRHALANLLESQGRAEEAMAT